MPFNFFTVVVALDPSNREGLKIASVLDNIIEQNIPIRFGLALVTESPHDFSSKMEEGKEDVKLEKSISLTITRAFNWIYQYNSRASLNFLRIVISFYD